MTTTGDAGTRHPVDQLAEDFVNRVRRGERPSLSEYVHQYPSMAGELTDIIEALLLLEDLGTNDGATDNFIASMPDRLGDYRIIREIGRGGMGVVYEAEQLDLGRRVALKVLPAVSLLRPAQLERFRREARAAARLHHTNIIPVYGVGTHEGIHFYAMQHIPGRGLDAIIADIRNHGSANSADTAQAAATPLSGTSQSNSIEYYRNVARVGLQVAEALAHAHEHGVLHRDVKPANIVLDNQGAAWLGDFGLAQLEGDAPLTSTGGFVGTLRYLAPERFQSEGDGRSDVYSLGATIYELLTLQPMFDETDRARLIRQVTLDEPPAPCQVACTIPKDLETIVLKSIAKNPTDRYPSANELAEDLQRFLADRPVDARRLSTWELLLRWVRRNPVVFGLLTAVILSMGVGLGATWWQWRRANEHLRARTKALEETELQKQRAHAHGRRAFLMLDALMSELTKTPDGRPGIDTHRALLQRALRLHQEFLDRNTVEPEERIDVARLAILAGDLNVELRKSPQIEKYFRMALELVEPEASDVNSPAGYREIKARALSNWSGTFRSSAARRDEFQKMALESVAIFRQLANEFPAHPEYQRMMCAPLRNLSIRARLDGQHETAVSYSLQAIDVCNEILSHDPTDDKTRFTLIGQLQTLALSYEQLNQREPALATIEHASNISKSMMDQASNNLSVGDAYCECELTWGAIFMREALAATAKDKTTARQSYQDAERHMRLSLAERDVLLNKNPGHITFRSKRTKELNNLGFVLLKLSRFDEAESCLIRAIDEQRIINQLQPQVRDYVRNLLDHYRILGQVYCFSGRHVKSAELVPIMVDIKFGDGRECVSAARVLSHCITQVAKDTKLDVAERKRLADTYTHHSLDLLKQAIDRGYRDREALETTGDLNSLHSNPVFRNLVNSLPKKSKSSGDDNE